MKACEFDMIVWVEMDGFIRAFISLFLFWSVCVYLSVIFPLSWRTIARSVASSSTTTVGSGRRRR